MSDLQLLVFSRLSETLPLKELPQTVRTARARAANLGLAGGMLFDGERVVQAWAGRHEDVHAALGTLQDDIAHRGMNVLHVAPGEPTELGTLWRVGYCEPQVLDTVLLPAPPAQAMARFMRLLQQADAA